jgi:hypothetical protein
MKFRKPMTESEREMLTTLCARISEEKDPLVFEELLVDLNALLVRVAGPPPTDT